MASNVYSHRFEGMKNGAGTCQEPGRGKKSAPEVAIALRGSAPSLRCSPKGSRFCEIRRLWDYGIRSMGSTWMVRRGMP
jgi:hypothetical protein